MEDVFVTNYRFGLCLVLDSCKVHIQFKGKKYKTLCGITEDNARVFFRADSGSIEMMGNVMCPHCVKAYNGISDKAGYRG